MNKIKNIIKKVYFLWHQDIRYYLDLKSNYYLYNIWSWCQNQTHIQQGCVKDTTQYKYFDNIHKFLGVKKLAMGEVTRIGKNADGGYFMAINSEGKFTTDDSFIAYSLGIANDVSWDLKMAEQGYNIYQYDHTIKKLPEQNPKFHWEKIGIAGNNKNKNLRTLSSLISQNGHSHEKGMILKCDIEGAEWDMFDEMSLELLSRFDQILVEFHNIVTGDNKNQIYKVFQKLSKTHTPVHIHANNNGVVNYCENMVTPDLLEVTFVNKDSFKLIECNNIYPLEMDQTNHLQKQDIILGYWNR